MTTKEKVFEALSETDGYISGQALAVKLGLSRNSVWKAVKQLQEEGCLIEAVSNKGYRLTECADVLSEGLLSSCLSVKKHNIIVLNETDSTNNYAKKLAAKGAEDGTIIISDTQTAGKGRLGRSFCSPPGIAVYMTEIIRPETDMQTNQLITSCAAVAVSKAVDELCKAETKIKWVNDIYLNEKKICGILTEASLSFESGQLDYAVIGIGVNVRSVKEYFDEKLLETATSIEDETGKAPLRCVLAAKIADNLDLLLGDIENHSFMEEYRKRSCIIGCRVAVSKYNGGREALAVGIDDNAGLIVKYDDGTEEVLNSGEARIIKESM